MENPGIDPGTSRMLSGRSTIWANSPVQALKLLIKHYFKGRNAPALPFPFLKIYNYQLPPKIVAVTRKTRSYLSFFLSLHKRVVL